MPVRSQATRLLTSIRTDFTNFGWFSYKLIHLDCRASLDFSRKSKLKQNALQTPGKRGHSTKSSKHTAFRSQAAHSNAFC